MCFLLLAFLFLLPSCSSPLHIVTDGSHKRLPEKSARIAVWGLRPVVTNTVVVWLRNNGFTVMEPSELQQAFDKENIRVSRSFADEHHAIRVAKQLGVGLVIFTQSAVETNVVNRASTTTTSTPFPGAVRTSFSSASVALRGIEVASSQLIFSATARYPQQLDGAGPGTLSTLACLALETALGVSPPGELALSPGDPCLPSR
ncbi:MAG: hypothetical protein A3K11_15390 [Nitrospirae bacterium RIFCSPLOWO2_12_FULL_63_8]|nr:MAG: hypothetical protein A3K11_15390 [Nitrospirae bacterium RIFCSPLOWO2_12_FULL_63_8]